jgi:hypothetical protein
VLGHVTGDLVTRDECSALDHTSNDTKQVDEVVRHSSTEVEGILRLNDVSKTIQHELRVKAYKVLKALVSFIN